MKWQPNSPGTLAKHGACIFFGAVCTRKGTEYYLLEYDEFGDLLTADEYRDYFSEWGPDDFSYISIE